MKAELVKWLAGVGFAVATILILKLFLATGPGNGPALPPGLDYHPEGETTVAIDAQIHETA